MTTVLRARRFLEAFSAAVHDVQLERRGCRIYHFFDSDFLGRLIFGFRDPLNHALIRDSRMHDINNLSSQRLLMGSLIGQGIGAPPLMRALLPHLYEVRRSVEGPRSHEARNSLQLAMDELGIKASLDELRSALAEHARGDDLLARFLDHGPHIFYGTELLSGRWEARLGRVLELGIREPGPFHDDSESVGSPAFEVLAQHVVHTGRESRGNGGVSGLRDAMALATLADAVAGDDGAEAERVEARFYTETPRIHRAWRESPDMRALLSYRVRDGAVGHDDYGQRGVLRTVDYYLIRALIPELGYDNDADAGDAGHTIFTIAGHLSDAAKELDRGGLGAYDLADVRVGQSTLGEYMAEVTDLSSYGTAWRRLMENIPRGLPKTLVTQLEEVFRGERRRADDLEQSFRRHVKSLSTRTRDVGEFTETYVHLLEALGRWEGALRPKHGDYSEHVGLTRWGLAPTDEDELELRHLIDAYADWLQERQAPGAGDLSTAGAGLVIEIAQSLRDIRAAQLQGPERLPASVALLGFLWLLEDYRSVAKYADELLIGIETAIAGRRGAKTLDAGDLERWTRYGAVAENLAAAAGIQDAVARLRGAPTDAQTELLVARTRELVSGLEEGRRRFPACADARAITQGYVLFHAWLAFNPTVMADTWAQPSQLRQRALMKDSFQIGISALNCCDSGSPMYALLLNHCVYVASMARLFDDGTARLAEKLIVHRLSERQARSYRLDDTLGYFYYARAAVTLAELGRAGPADALEDVQQARRWLDRVPREVSDPEVLTHRGLLRELEVRLRREAVSPEPVG